MRYPHRVIMKPILLKIILLLLAGSAITLISCESSSTNPGPDPFDGKHWDTANDYLYQIQNLDLQQVGDSAFDIIIMDLDNSDGDHYSYADITGLKNSSGGAKLVLCYINIGAAEDWRYYWQSGWGEGNPSWIGPPYEGWSGEYYVQYWDPQWQAIIYGSADAYVDLAIAAGFDGIYLDNVLNYEYWRDHGYPNAEQDMSDFVQAIANYARNKTGNPDFGIFPQNAPEVGLHYSSYMDCTTGIGMEDIYFLDTDIPTDQTTRDLYEAQLANWTSAGKVVLDVNYATNTDNVRYCYTRSRQMGYVPYCTVVDLDRMTINDEFPPD